MYLFGIMDLYLHLGYLGPLGAFWIPLTHGKDNNSWFKLGLMVQTRTHGIDLESWYVMSNLGYP